MRFRSLALFIVLALAIMAGGWCGTLPRSSYSTAPKTIAADTTASPSTTGLPKIEVSVYSITPYLVAGGLLAPKGEYKYLLVDFALTNYGFPNGFTFYPMINARLTDADGYSYKHCMLSRVVPGHFGVTTIPQGETVYGKLVFDVPDKESTYTLVVE